MIALGLALILIAAGATVFAVIASANTPTAIELTAFNVTISATPLGLLIAGALVVALVVLGLALISRGTRRTARTHRELKQLRKENAIAATRAAAERENDVSGDSTDETTDSSATGSRKGAGGETSKSTDGEKSKSPNTTSDVSSAKGYEQDSGDSGSGHSGSGHSGSGRSGSGDSGDTDTDGTAAQTAPGR